MPISKEHHKISNQDWDSYTNQATQGVIFTNFAYQNTDEDMQKMAEQIPPGYQMFLMTDHVEDSKEASFRCVAFINEETKEIVFATAGTRPGLNKTAVHDLYDDAMLVMQTLPVKMEPAAILNDMILDSLGDKAKEFKFHYTGHSLGAAMAEMQAVDMDIKLQKKGLKDLSSKEQITAVTFENPGTKPIVEKMYKNAGLPEKSVQNLKFCEFNNRPNMVNSLNPQSGETYRIIPNSQKERNPSYSQMIFEVVAKYAEKLCPLVSKAFSLLAPGGIGMELLSDHSLENFNEVFVQKSGIVKNKSSEIMPLQEAYTGLKPIEYDEKIAAKIKELQEKSPVGAKHEFSMEKFDPQTQTLERLTCTKQELQTAFVAVRNEERADEIKGHFTAKFASKAKGNIAQQIIGSKTTDNKIPTADQALAQSSLHRSF